MTKLAVIGTFYKRFEQSRACVQRVLDSTRKPDELWLMCESQEDADNLKGFSDPSIRLHVLSTPMTNGKYDVIPYSNKINWALDRAKADIITFLDNGSMPHIDKYRQMAETLENNPDMQAVYCTQHRTGFINVIHRADRVIEDPYCVINYTQGMYRTSSVRWTLDMQWAAPSDLADAMFWRDLGVPFHPIGSEILDEHHMESSAANGL